jgi:predicted RNA-binding Zn ribbon-like protein
MTVSRREKGVSQPAPGRLELIRAFVNTNDIDAHHDALTSPEVLRAWLTAHSLLHEDEAVTDEDLRRVQDLREALRALLLANNGAELDAHTPEVLNQLAGSFCLLIQFDQNGQAHLTPGSSGINGAMSQMLDRVMRAMIDGTWTRLKACRNETCRWAFYDTSKNRSATWCTMAVCGSRLKSRAYRQRHNS